VSAADTNLITIGPLRNAESKNHRRVGHVRDARSDATMPSHAQIVSGEKMSVYMSSYLPPSASKSLKRW